MHPAAATQAIEVALLVSTAALFLLSLAVFLHKDGPTWTVFRINVVSWFMASLGGYLGIHTGVFVPQNRGAILTLLVLGLVGLGRLVGAITSIVLALHLRNQDRNGVPPPTLVQGPIDLHRGGRQEGTC